MPELSLEQHQRIESLAVEHGRVVVERPADDGTVKVTAGHKTMVLNEDGDQLPQTFADIPMRLSTSLLRRMLGDDVVDAALDNNGTNADYSAGFALRNDVTARIVELLATSEQMATRAAGWR